MDAAAHFMSVVLAEQAAADRMRGALLVLVLLAVFAAALLVTAFLRAARRAAKGRQAAVRRDKVPAGPDPWFEAGRRMPTPPDPDGGGAATDRDMGPENDAR